MKKIVGVIKQKSSNKKKLKELDGLIATVKISLAQSESTVRCLVLNFKELKKAKIVSLKEFGKINKELGIATLNVDNFTKMINKLHEQRQQITNSFNQPGTLFQIKAKRVGGKD